MIKTMLTLLLIAGIILAARAGPAVASNAGMRSDAGAQDWWQDHLRRYLSARFFSEVPWLNYISSSQMREGRAVKRIFAQCT
jgi:hypothetical protein